MTIQLLTFGQITDLTGQSSFAISDVQTTDELLQKLTTLYPALSSVKFSLAVNKKIIQGNVELFDNDVVALLPPFSGG